MEKTQGGSPMAHIKIETLQQTPKISEKTGSHKVSQGQQNNTKVSLTWST